MPKKKSQQARNKALPASQCRTIRDPNGHPRKFCCQRKPIARGDMGSYKHLPKCDGSGFPYVKGCFKDMSNWVPGPKQCIIQNPGTTNLNHGSIYTCGFLW